VIAPPAVTTPAAADVCNRCSVAPTPTIRVRATRLTFHVAEAASDYGFANTPSEAAAIARAVIGDDTSECVIALYVNTRHRVIGYSEIARGSLNSARFAPRDVFARALILNARGVILAHNHPSGDPTPSSADRRCTHTLRQGASILGVDFIDHLVVTANAGVSMRSNDPSWR
jgi:DNA repair protein RadC